MTYGEYWLAKTIKGRPYKYGFHTMVVPEVWMLPYDGKTPTELQNLVTRSLHYWRQMLGWDFTTRRTPDGLRVMRVS